MHTVLFAGLSWSPAISGILTVVVGVVVLMGSIYLIIATNTGARLGLLIALAGLFGWLSILTLYWWITPPGIGPRGQDPSWRPVEIYVHEPNAGPALTEAVNFLTDPGAKNPDGSPIIPSAAEVIAAHPELKDQIVGKPQNAILPDIVAVKNGDAKTGADILQQYYGVKSVSASEAPIGTDPPALGCNADQTMCWKLVTPSLAGEASAAADAAILEAKIDGLEDATKYKKVNYYETGGDLTRAEACPAGESQDEHNLIPPDVMCRAVYRIKKTFNLWHPPRYQVVQIQQVIPQEAKAGEPPPTPVVDPTKPVISVVLIRDQGNVRAKPAYFFVICFSIFLALVLILHYRDKTLMKHLEEAEKAKAEAKAKR